jgi:hypothetical protein
MGRMDQTVRQYKIPSSQIAIPWGKSVMLFFLVALTMFALRWGTDKLFHWSHGSLFDQLFMPIVFGAWFAFRPLSFAFAQGDGKLIVGENFVEGHTRIGNFL